MKTIAISTAKESLDAPVEALFGRARFFILADPGTMEWEALDNLPSLSANQLVGVMTAQRLVRKNIQTIMTGKCGSKAFAELKSAGVQVILDTKGTVRQALERFKQAKSHRQPVLMSLKPGRSTSLPVRKKRTKGLTQTTPVRVPPTVKNGYPAYPSNRNNAVAFAPAS